MTPGARSAKPEAKYHWKADESVSKGLRRIVREQFEIAIWQLAENTASLDKAVHEARKCIKKIRSALRLVKYDEANEALRDGGRKLSPLRDAQALLEIFDELNDKYRDTLGDHNLVSIRDGLVARKDKLCRDFQRQRLVTKVLKRLRGLAAGVEKWNLEKDVETISKGFGRTIRRNRKARDSACLVSRPEAFHEWRKRAKDLRYQLELVGKAWPPVLEGYGNAAKELEGKLGDDHNLAVLRDAILRKPDDFGNHQDISALMKVVEHHQQHLRSEART
jgi:CHAD domain-containing protein